MNVAPSTSFEAVADLGATGLVGTCGVRIIDNAGATTVPRTTAGIIEHPTGSAIYEVVIAGLPAGTYTIVWDIGSDAPGNMAIEELVVA